MIGFASISGARYGIKKVFKSLVARGEAKLRCSRFKKGVFTLKDPKKIAMSLKRSAEQSHRRKSAPYRSAMSMLTFYINPGGQGIVRDRPCAP